VVPFRALNFTDKNQDPCPKLIVKRYRDRSANVVNNPFVWHRPPLSLNDPVRFATDSVPRGIKDGLLHAGQLHSALDRVDGNNSPLD
jgi:hypothetical protein